MCVLKGDKPSRDKHARKGAEHYRAIYSHLTVDKQTVQFLNDFTHHLEQPGGNLLGRTRAVQCLGGVDKLMVSRLQVHRQA